MRLLNGRMQIGLLAAAEHVDEVREVVAAAALVTARPRLHFRAQPGLVSVGSVFVSDRQVAVRAIENVANDIGPLAPAA